MAYFTKKLPDLLHIVFPKHCTDRNEMTLAVGQASISSVLFIKKSTHGLLYKKTAGLTPYSISQTSCLVPTEVSGIHALGPPVVGITSGGYAAFLI